MMIKELTVQIDSREQYPIQFPSNVYIEDPDHPRKQILVPVKTERVALKAGDYRLKEFPDVCIVERKASLLEVNKNMLNSEDNLRQCKAFMKLKEACLHPVLLMETSPWEMASQSARRQVTDPDLVLYRLTKVIAHYGLELFWAGRTTSVINRRYLGQTLIYLMYCHGINETNRNKE